MWWKGTLDRTWSVWLKGHFACFPLEGHQMGHFIVFCPLQGYHTWHFNTLLVLCCLKVYLCFVCWKGMIKGILYPCSRHITTFDHCKDTLKGTRSHFISLTFHSYPALLLPYSYLIFYFLSFCVFSFLYDYNIIISHRTSAVKRKYVFLCCLFHPPHFS